MDNIPEDNQPQTPRAPTLPPPPWREEEDTHDHASALAIWTLAMIWGFLCGLLIGWLIWG